MNSSKAILTQWDGDTVLFENVIGALKAHGYALLALANVHGVYHALVKGAQMYYVARDMCMSGEHAGTWASTVTYSVDEKKATKLFDEFVKEEKRAN